ncbi:monovalent cation/H+ antiporter subunit E [Halalkalirubrum salinum]|uniref:monovalent cation/H+ antiporter subunit E n=1 Tax=Halalkalirubrum salinum TaxID=2563889 RepID=UPI0010FAD51E|nr:monovalent cation/H+ antiporter subunit E [Halalkalirubrum salinum]
MTGNTTRLLVPVTRSRTLRNTVAYVIDEAIGAGTDSEPSVVHFVVLSGWRSDDPGSEDERADAEALLDRVTFWAELDLEEADAADATVQIETTIVGTEEYLFSPSDYARVLSKYAKEHKLERVIVDPEYSLVGHITLLGPLEFELAQADLTVEEAPVERPTRRSQFVGRTNAPRFLALFGGSFMFYQVLGGFSDLLGGGVFDIVTGAMTALIVAVVLSNVSFYRNPSVVDSPKRIVRGLIYAPYLLYEIFISNIAVARVVLDPRASIDPKMTKIRVFVGSGLPLVTLANSITLTPGTVTVRARNQELYVHSLLQASRDGLFDGGLERWVRFVFYGRSAARFPSPLERGDTEVLQGSAVDADNSGETDEVPMSDETEENT